MWAGCDLRDRGPVLRYVGETTMAIMLASFTEGLFYTETYELRGVSAKRPLVRMKSYGTIKKWGLAASCR